MVAQFDEEEWGRRSEVDHRYDGATRSLIIRTGWSSDHALVLDLQTGEGAMFLLGGMPKADLDKHKVWVCPMFEPFLAWLYKWPAHSADPVDWMADLPALVELPDAPASMQGYRRVRLSMGRDSNQ